MTNLTTGSLRIFRHGVIALSLLTTGVYASAQSFGALQGLADGVDMNDKNNQQMVQLVLSDPAFMNDLKSGRLTEQSIQNLCQKMARAAGFSSDKDLKGVKIECASSFGPSEISQLNSMFKGVNARR